jgi:ubiquinone/menaquinone biosynthesis C-methylase UbiE
MKRIPEPELMDDVEQAEAYAAADFSDPHDAFVRGFIERFPDFRAGSVLDLGCGTGDVIIRFARALPEVNITAVDGAGAMLRIARKDIIRTHLSDRIELLRLYLPDDRLDSMRFDALISNSLLHHLENPFVLWDAVNSCTADGAPVYIMDLHRPDDIDRAGRLVARYAADESPVLQKDFYNSLLAAYTVDEVREQLRTASLDYLQVDMISDRHLLVWGRKEH